MSEILVPFLESALDVARREGIVSNGWASARYVATGRETLARNPRGVEHRRDTHRATAVRALYKGGTGIATTTDPSAMALEDAAAEAIASARVSDALPDPSLVYPSTTTTGTFGAAAPLDTSPTTDDGFEGRGQRVPPPPAAALSEWLDPTSEWLARMLETELVCDAAISLESVARSSWLATTAGASVEQHVRSLGLSMRATACHPDRPADKVSRRFHIAAGGAAEILDGLDGLELARRLAGEAALLVKAPGALPSQKSLVLAPDVMAVLVHETLARRLVAPTDSPSALAIGDTLDSALLTATAEPIRADGLGTYGFDDEGRAAEPVTLIEAGTVTARLAAEQIAVRRSFALDATPRPTLTNVDLAAGDASFEQLVTEAGDSGLFVTDPVRWWLSPDATTIVIACAMARYCSAKGTLGGFVRGPVIEAPVAALWASMTRVGAERENRPSPICGTGPAGEPLRVSHLVPAALFTDIRIGPGASELRGVE